MKLVITSVFVFCFLIALANGQTPSPLPEGAGVGEIFSSIVEIFKNWSGLSYQYKIAAVLFIIVGIFKNSALAPYWNGLGKLKPFVAPFLSLVAFLFMIQPFTLDAFIAAITTGVAAGYFAQIVDALKLIPGLGSYIEVISIFIGKVFKKPQQ